jgi:NAD+ kinase
MKKIGIVVNSNKPGAAQLLPRLCDWLTKREVATADTTQLAIDEVIRDSSLVICLGGDGTLLSVANHMKENSVPVLGVNLGALGFLTEVKQEEVFEELNSFLIGQSVIEDRLMLSCTASSSKSKQERRLLALNDIVVSREGLSRILRLEVQVTKEKVTNFAGDGIIVATPTGSTAYSLSAGGAIIHPKLEAIIITPICPHASALRSMVVAAGEKISVKIQRTGLSGKALLTADGQENLEIDDSYSVEITRATTSLKLVKSSKRSYFATLRENFKFPE